MPDPLFLPADDNNAERPRKMPRKHAPKLTGEPKQSAPDSGDTETPTPTKRQTPGAKRRGRGEGSIYQRDDGRWTAQLDLGFINGKRVRKTIYGKTRKEVSDKLHELREKHRKGLPVDSPRIRVGDYLEHWITSILPGSVKPSTVTFNRSIVRQHLIPGLGRLWLDKLSQHDIREFIAAKALETSPRTKRKYKQRTLIACHSVLKAALEQACKDDLLFRNVAKLVDPPQASQVETVPLTIEQLRTLLEAARRERLHPAYLIGAVLGLRKGEVLGLRWQDVDLDDRVMIRVRKTLQRIDGELVLGSVKSDDSERPLPIPPSLKAALTDWHATQRKDKAEAGEDWIGNRWDLVFTTSAGTPIDPRNFYRDFLRFLARVKLPRIRFHDMRHSFATALGERGKAIEVIQKILGHSDVKITAKIYRHIVPHEVRTAVEELDAVLNGPQSAAVEPETDEEEILSEEEFDTGDETE